MDNQNGVRNRRADASAEAQRHRRSLLENNTDALIDKPLSHLTHSELDEHVEQAFNRWGLPKYLLPLFLKAGQVAQNPDDYKHVKDLTKEERAIFRKESKSTFWDETKALKLTIFACCLGAIVQGWNQTGSNAANLNWPDEFGLQLKTGNSSGKSLDTWSYAAVNAAPFLSAALGGCWLSDPLNEFLYGRRGATFIAGLLCFSSVIAAACTHSTKALLGCRVLLGIGMGAKASVIPIYAAEVSPAKLRGSLVMNWQLFTAFGELLGFSANLALARVDKLAWRLQMASAFLPTIPLIAIIFACPESPRFLMKKGRFRKAYKSLCALRGSQIQAAKEMIDMDAQIQAAESKLMSRLGDEEAEVASSDTGDIPSDERTTDHASLSDRSSTHSSQLNQEDSDRSEDENESEDEGAPVKLRSRLARKFGKLKEVFKQDEKDNGDPRTFEAQFKLTNYWSRIAQLITVPRTRRASLAAFVVMISQQLCAINILAFYSTTLFRDADATNMSTNNQGHNLNPLWYSWGFGLTNFLFAFPAYPLIDRKAITLVATALAYNIPASSSARTPVVYFLFILFTIFYSPGGGPVPFTYSSEVFPLVNREQGMSFAVSWNLLGAGLLTLFVPQITATWGEMKLIGLFAGLCTFAFCLIFVFVPETSNMTLEEINYIFGVPTGKHASYQLKKVLPYFVDHYFLRFIFRNRKRLPKPANLYRWWNEQKSTRQKINEKEQDLGQEEQQRTESISS
ncbi:MFS general substrate transporter [Tothia fuscella]|uniref:MFS general substrate transporter n=1 Tax=Tothia fuscella TaxID=1048955 RepID=A0A9P4NSX1_9PEZI|nr:MFS general substrate transporter [Tothia fuscella]